MLEAKTKNQGPKRKCSPKKKAFKEIFQAISKNYGLEIHFSADVQKFNHSKTRAVLEPWTGNFRGLEASRPRPRP